MELIREEEELVSKSRWAKEVAQAEIQHRSHSDTQTGSCCEILMIEGIKNQNSYEKTM